MRILHVLDHSIPLQSGYSFRTLEIIRHQCRLGWHTMQLTGSKHIGNENAEEVVNGLRFYRTSDQGFLHRLPLVNQYAVIRSLESRLTQVIEKERPDVLHAHSPCLNGLAALHIGKRLGIPVVYEMRASWEDAAVNLGRTREGSLRYVLSRALETHVLLQAQTVVTICEGLRKEVIARGVGDRKVYVIPNGVDVERFSVVTGPDPVLRSDLGLENKKVLGFFGSFYAYEGLPILLNALPRVLDRIPQTRVLLAGGGPQDRSLRALTSSLNLADKVIFAGRVPHEEVGRYYSLADILVYPRLSVRLTELVTPLKPLEAMAQGCLVVASDVGGHRELIRDRVNGRLFRAGDPEALACALLEVLENESAASSLRREGRAFVVGERSWTSIVARYRPIYEHSLSR